MFKVNNKLQNKVISHTFLMFLLLTVVGYDRLAVLKGAGNIVFLRRVLYKSLIEVKRKPRWISSIGR